MAKEDPDPDAPRRPSPAVPTLEDVARRSGVSTATVSRCLNDPKRVSELTRTKVMHAIRSLGYAPNFGARALAAKRTNTFGAIIPTMENAVFAQGLQAFQEELGEHGVTLLVASSAYRRELEEDQIRALIARGADALLLIGHDRTEESYDLLARRGIPHVVTWAYDPAQSRPAIGFDNRSAMKALASEVFALGHRTVGLISAFRGENDRARQRHEGVLDAMSAAGLRPETLRILETAYSIEHGAEALEAMMGADPRITAVLCGNDVLAAGAIKRATALGLRVPEDLSITGFDDIEIAEIVSPGLTTVHVPHQAMGRGAAKMLLALRNGEMPETRIALGAHIKWRASLAAPRATANA